MLSRTAPGQPGRTVYANALRPALGTVHPLSRAFQSPEQLLRLAAWTRGCHSHVILARHQTLKIIRPEFMSSLLLNVSVCHKSWGLKLLLLLGTGGRCRQAPVCSHFLLGDLRT